MPNPVVYIARHGALGFALGVAFGVLVVASNVGGLRDLLTGSSDVAIALPLLLGMCGLTFAGLVMGGAIMSLPDKNGDH